MEFTKQNTNIAKGVAIFFMFAHHLYSFDDRLLNGNTYIPLIPFFNAEAYIGRFGNICVSMFLFLSGYGMFLGYLRSEKTLLNYSLVKLRNFYSIYWSYFLIFVPIGIFFFPKVTLWHSAQARYSAAPITFIANLLGWDSTYNGEWWFVKVFAVTLLLLFPFYEKLASKNVIYVAFASLLLFSLSSKVDAYDKLGFIFWQTSFALGIICAKLKFFSSHLIKDLDELGWIWVLSWLSLCFILRTKIGSSAYDFLITPFFIYFSVRAIILLRLSRLFAYLGSYSFPLWLTHSFFCYYYFQDIIYFPKWSPLIFILLITMSLLSVLGIEYLRSSFLRLTMFGKHVHRTD